ncbi:endopeptidase La [Bdellovibrio bacteriovorus]|uniref:Lon protease 2 n=1 Tax=Bdellovibrio bacteriovorus (strain ATCC 15356 / DSM 50701 / NCIMB 9529 / HD100) TaxID=264462 RepID=LON2_BDEBA|nr:endopeptidase La [Bdellovibrio bacteriovorus]Q6MGP8.1 RecName: Full=Lon protease 2; AltName: Full=ATP-dependent protease La 2 [Bdellovibrio bacteriovorus HD100]AHZ85625.1 peptidase [Bdellovibrio bacteriovorus]BEV70171.1 Lon protease 1 [Bdellovibrio bacteriovorus]CAE81231.1 ATP-dependent protease La [Bdellovibrio bacteriovorus HD100]
MSFDDKVLEIPQTLPMLPVRDIVVFPYMIIPLFVGRDASIRSVEEALAKNRLIFLASQKDITEENPSPDNIYTVGTVAMIMRMRKLSDGRVKILIQGVAKGRVKNFTKTSPSFEVAVEKIEETPVQKTVVENEALIRTAKEHIERIIALGRPLSPDILLVLDDVSDPGRIADLIASNLGIKVQDAQKVLETSDATERLKLVNEILAAELEVMQTQSKNRTGAKDDMSKSQREYFLREQMKAIKNELGEGDSKSEEMDELREKLVNAGMPTHVEAEALKQLGRLERMHPDASEATMVRTYLDWMADLPWSKKSEDHIDLKRSKEILDEDHYELEKAKDRIMEFLAVRKLKPNLKGPILCFGGPPGVGKTSLGKSIARAMGREYFRIALGGVKDEAEIRGHRRTYVGAMPGKIIQALRQAKTSNPVIVLDEIDKLGSDFRGDPSAAMLEVLDPEQNATFRDNYLNVDFDLSNVLFIATANVLENIPPALRDRMEILNIPGYTENDKLLITKKHLIKRQIEANGITEENIKFTDEGIKYLIAGYTREAGLRNLEREVGSVCRKVAKMVVMEETNFVEVNATTVPELLGPPRFQRDDKIADSQVGVVQGLAWTQAGGEVLTIEALKMKGKGHLALTGQLGDVMKESAHAAMSYARAHQEELGIPEDFFEKYDVHVHLPAGAIPKDGPSAGITLTTALVSLMTGTPVRHDIAMTGEVTLQGRVLPVGGIREKCLAALNLGITNIIIPMACQKDLADIPKVFKDKINFILAENLDEVFAVAFDKSAKGQEKKPAAKKDPKKTKSLAA